MRFRRRALQPDIIVNNDCLQRHMGLSGRIINNSNRGIWALLENGERVGLKSNQFDYLAEQKINENNCSQSEN